MAKGWQGKKAFSLNGNHPFSNTRTKTKGLVLEPFLIIFLQKQKGLLTTPFGNSARASEPPDNGVILLHPYNYLLGLT